MEDEEKEDNEIEELTERLSPLELKIIPYLKLNIDEIMKKSDLDRTSILRALKFLENKGILKLNQINKRVIILGVNGIYYKKNHLPERRLLILLEEKNHLSLEEAKKLSGLSDNEFKVSLGVLKDKALISLSNGKISLNATKEELVKKSLEEQFIDSLPAEQEKLTPEQKFAFENLKKRRNIIEIEEQNIVNHELNDIGKKIAGKEIKSDLIEENTPEIIKTWSKEKKFRKYDIKAAVPHISGGKRHFVNQATEYAKRIWLDMGFKEMQGPIVDTSFWIFDALFTPQDHPAREMQDTFFIKDIAGKLPGKKLTNAIKDSHEKGVAGSKGWNYSWSEKEAMKLVMRTHTTSLSARTISQLKKTEIPSKYFAIGKVFRNETVDPGHLFEFNQTEGIVIDKNANFQHLLGYLKAFLNKMGFKKIRFRPHYFPYTEPSAEADVYNEKTGKWIEILGSGIFRPELVIPLFGEYVPVLAWGMGFDRLVKENYKIEDIREFYANDLKTIREKPAWKK
jgi:phenylalanyl-tRNA synthetase alpha chain